MPDEVKSDIDTPVDTSAAQQAPSPPLPPAVEEGNDGEGRDNKPQCRYMEKPKKKKSKIRKNIEVGCAVALVFITAFYTYYARKQAGAAITAADAAGRAADAAKTAADITRQTLEVSNRPWVSAGIEMKDPLKFTDAGASTTIAFLLKNVGHTPAIETAYRAKIVTLPEKTWQAIEIRDAEKRECESMRQVFIGSPHIFPTLFPHR